MSRPIPLVSVVMLASAIGPRPAIFGMVHAALMRFLPAADEERVLVLPGRDQARAQSLAEVGLADVDAWRRGVARFESIEVFGSVNWNGARIKVGTKSPGAGKKAVPAGFCASPGVGRRMNGGLLAPSTISHAGNTLSSSGIKVRNALAAVQLTAPLIGVERRPVRNASRGRRNMTKTAFARALVLISINTAFAQVLHAQTVPRASPAPSGPVRDARPPGAAPKVGTGSITGTVTLPGGQPIAGARVMINGAELAGGMSATSDAQGAFAFTAIPAGRYSLMVSKPGHVVFRANARSIRTPLTGVVLGDGEAKTVTVRLARGSVITGTVLDERGEPAINMPVTSMRYIFSGGQRRLQSSGGAITDDRGIYRLHSLEPGEYNICVTPRPGMVNPSLMPDSQRLRLEVDGMRNALGNAARNNMPAGTRETLQNRIAQVEARLSQMDAEPATGYAPVCAATGGAMLAVGPAEERSGVDIQLHLVPVARVEGTIVAPQGVAIGTPGPQGVQVNLTMLDESSGRISQGTSVDAGTGRFRFQNLPPGNYRVIARMGQFGMMPLPAPGNAAGAPPPPAPERMWAMSDFTVAGQDVINVTLDLQPALTVSGHVVFQGTKAPPDPAQMRISLSPMAVFPFDSGVAQPSQAQLDANGRFSIPGVLPGKYRIGVAATGWMAESAIVSGADALDTGLDMTSARSVRGLVVTLTDQQTSLSGVMLDEKGAAATEHTLLVYPADEKLWIPESRRFRTLRVMSDGKYEVRGMPPGDYRLAAFLDAEPGSWYDPAFLQQLDSGSLRVSLAPGEAKVQNVRVGEQ